ncbi:MAG: ATP-binding protein [Treponema sp.]|nr:ATP-binding protein [Treponema sp.]
MRNIYQDNLHKLMIEKMNEAQSRVLMPLKGLEVTLKFISDNIQNMMLGGESLDAVLKYLDECSDPANKARLSVIDYSSVFGFFPQIGLFHDGGNFVAPPGYNPSQRPWYTAGASGGGELMFVLYVDAAEGEKHTFAYSRGIFDNEDNLIAVIAMEVATHVITDYLVEKYLPEGGYGFILDENLRVLAHPNQDFMFRYLFDINSELADFTYELKNGINISERRLLNYRNERSIVFCQILENGWYVGIMANVKYFYADMNTMTAISIIICIILGVILCVIMANIVTAWNKAYEASRQKSTFLATVSHEIRTPMNSIIGFSELAMDDNILPATKDYIEKIHENAEGLLLIINDILDMSKVESGKMEMENIPFDIHDLLKNCRSLIMPKAIEKGLVLYFYAEPSVDKKPLGDPFRLRQVLVNILSNAVKFTNKGTIKLVVQIKEKTEKTITMRFEIKDSGIGMTSEQISRIFDPFLQAEAGTTRKFGGTGLGLAITKKIVEAMGGKISVESTLDVGSKFSFEIKFNTIDSTDNDMLLYNEKINLNKIKKPFFDGEVLLCEDNNMNQHVIYEHLARVGIKTVVAENGKIGLDMVKERIEKNIKLFDLIFMDIHMPVMDGIEAAEKIMGLNIGIPIIALTANIMSEDRELYKEMGMNGYLGKPFTSQELWHCLLKYLKPVVCKNEISSIKGPLDNELRSKIIKIFVKDNKGRYDEIIESLKNGDIKTAHRLAHNMKSNASQLDKADLQQAAKEVEDALKNGENLVTQYQIERLQTELNAVLNEFGQFISEFDTKQDSSQQLDKTASLKLLDDLKPVLIENNINCLLYIDDLRLIPGSEELISRIENFKFTAAVETLVELKNKIK